MAKTNNAKKNNEVWTEYLKPVVVLMTICIVVSGILAFANGITTPIIEENARLAADAARIELLPEATDGFDKIEDVTMEGVKEVYKAKNGCGYTVTAFGKGYGGEVVYMVAFDNDGVIVNAKVLEQSETAGLGAKITEPSFYEQFKGKDKELTPDDIDMITGATISSKASLTAINNARKAFNQYAKGIVVVELTLEEKIGQLFGEDAPAAVLASENVYTVEGKGTVVAATGDGFSAKNMGGEPITAYVAFNEDGTIANVMIDASNDTPGIGDKVQEKAFTDLFIGKTDASGIDVIAGSTFSSNASIEAVGKACEVFAGL